MATAQQLKALRKARKKLVLSRKKQQMLLRNRALLNKIRGAERRGAKNIRIPLKRKGVVSPRQKVVIPITRGEFIGLIDTEREVSRFGFHLANVQDNYGADQVLDRMIEDIDNEISYGEI